MLRTRRGIPKDPEKSPPKAPNGSTCINWVYSSLAPRQTIFLPRSLALRRKGRRAPEPTKFWQLGPLSCADIGSSALALTYTNTQSHPWRAAPGLTVNRSSDLSYGMRQSSPGTYAILCITAPCIQIANFGSAAQ